MKKLLVLLAFAGTAVSGFAAGAAVVSAPVLESLTISSHLEDVVYFTQQVSNQIQSLYNDYEQIQNMIRSEQRALENLKGITQVTSFDGFMNWYNRQLYLERQAENKFKNTDITVGRHSYKLDEISNIPAAVNQTYGEGYWGRGLTPEERADMWMTAGMTPANYAYVQTWKAKEEEIGYILTGNPDIFNDDYMLAMSRNRELSDKVMNQDVGEKGILQAIFEVMVDTNKATRESAVMTAQAYAQAEARARMEKAPGNAFTLSPGYGQSYFKPIYVDENPRH